MVIDPFQSSVWDDAGVLSIERAGLEDYLDFRSSFSCPVLPDLLSSGQAEQINLAYIDSYHLFEDVFIDWYYVARLLAPNGVLFDDAIDAHVSKVIRFVRQNFSDAFQPIDLSPYREDRGRSFKYRVASALGKTQFAAFRKIGPAERSWDSRFKSF